MESKNLIQTSASDESKREPTSKELIESVISEDEESSVFKAAKESDANGKITFEFNKKTVKYIAAAAVLIVLFAWGINNGEKVSEIIGGFFSIISPFIIGFCIAFVVNVLMRPLENLFDKIFKNCNSKTKDKVKRPVCLLLSIIILFGLLFALLFMILPEFKTTFDTLIKAVPQYISQIEVWISKLIDFASHYGITLPEMSFNSDKILDTLKNFINDSGIVDKTLNFTGSIVTGIVNLIIAVAFSLYLLAQKEKLSNQMKKFLRAFLPKQNDVNRLVNFAEIVDRTFTSFVTGQLLEAVIIGVLCFIGMLIFKMPYAAVISVLVGFTALIPVFGAFIGTAIGAFLILFISPIKAIWFVVFIVILQQLEGNLIYPKVVGKSVGLPGIWVLTAVSIGGTLAGVSGILISVPACAVIYCLLANIVNARIKKKEKAEKEQKIIQGKKQIILSDKTNIDK